MIDFIAYFSKTFQDASDDDDSSNDGGDRNENLGNNSSDMTIDSMETQSSLGQDMMIEPVIKHPAEVDPDGWTTVATRRNKGRRN